MVSVVGIAQVGTAADVDQRDPSRRRPEDLVLSVIDRGLETIRAIVYFPNMVQNRLVWDRQLLR